MSAESHDSKRTARRRWLRFSLRGLLIAVALVALPLAYPLRWIHERHEAIKDNIARMDQAGKTSWDLSGGWESFPANPAQAPSILGLFGEPGLPAITFLYIVDEPPKGMTPEMLRMKSLFPEATLTWSFVDRNGNFFPATEEDE
ncbi:MAG: hypothetical protein DWQ37_13925 [Planctomycetota bacterium]|nr:MAG: hypothetical protein DWQ37_13925 [Planctomycetota bacterium]